MKNAEALHRNSRFRGGIYSGDSATRSKRSRRQPQITPNNRGNVSAMRAQSVQRVPFVDERHDFVLGAEEGEVVEYVRDGSWLGRSGGGWITGM
jgi:hypothetical protein